jgi:FixJ family two-component response regulator
VLRRKINLNHPHLCPQAVTVSELVSHYRQRELVTHPSCLILDVRLPRISGLDLQHELKRRKVSIAIIFLTAHADFPMSVKAMKPGAVEFCA